MILPPDIYINNHRFESTAGRQTQELFGFPLRWRAGPAGGAERPDGIPALPRRWPGSDVVALLGMQPWEQQLRRARRLSVAWSALRSAPLEIVFGFFQGRRPTCGVIVESVPALFVSHSREVEKALTNLEGRSAVMAAGYPSLDKR